MSRNTQFRRNINNSKDINDVDNITCDTINAININASGTITGGGIGEVNTASNILGSGVGLFKQKNGVDLEFKRVNTGSNKVTITDNIGNDEVDIDIVEGNINHDNLNGFVTNEHIDHSTININAGTDLNGGGDITTSRTLNLNSAITVDTIGERTITGPGIKILPAWI